MLADFTITVNEARKPLAVQVKVHDSVAALRGAAKKYSQRVSLQNEGDFSDTLGICHRFHMANDPVVALVRLAPPHLGAGIVAHELTHAAVWMWEIHNKFSRDTPLNCENDEWFAWVLGELVRLTTTKLIEHKIYS